MTTSPVANSDNVAAGSDLYVAFKETSGTLDTRTLRIVLDQRLIWDGLNGFIDREFPGEMSRTADMAFIRIRPRRHFKKGRLVTLTVSTSPASDTQIRFNVAKTPRAVPHISLETDGQSRLREAFPPGWPVLEAFRQNLVESLAPSALFTEALIYRIKTSECEPILRHLSINVNSINAAEFYSLSNVLNSMRSVERLWSYVLEELKSLGLGPTTAEMFDRTYQSAYPQNRVGAICATLLLAGNSFAARQE